METKKPRVMVQFRVQRDLYFRFKERATANGMSVADFMRFLAIRELRRKIRGAGRNQKERERNVWET